MYEMQIFYLCCILIWSISCISAVFSLGVNLSHNGPIVLGGTITFKAELFTEIGELSSRTYKYYWKDNASIPHEFTIETKNTTCYWTVSYPKEHYVIGDYKVELVVSKHFISFLNWPVTKSSITFKITDLLNGNITISQSNETRKKSFISSLSETKFDVELSKGDYNYISKNATYVLTHWFIDCRYFGFTNDFSFAFNFTEVDRMYNIQALVIASFVPMPMEPTTLASITENMENGTITPIDNSTITGAATSAITTALPMISTLTTNVSANSSDSMPVNSTLTTPLVKADALGLPYICSSIIPPDPNKTYGYFTTYVKVRAPITHISVEGTNWIQPWDMLSLNVSCDGSGPFYKCLQFHRGNYNITGNETCVGEDVLNTCNFHIIHYFLEPSVYTILVIVNNEVSKQVSLSVINIYKVTTKPQLSVIVVPVTCSLVAVVLIVFGVAYYVQSKAKFTVEVANFDFGQSNPDMEYKTFTERLRDSFNNAGYKPLNSAQSFQT